VRRLFRAPLKPRQCALVADGDFISLELAAPARAAAGHAHDGGADAGEAGDDVWLANLAIAATARDAALVKWAGGGRLWVTDVALQNPGGTGEGSVPEPPYVQSGLVVTTGARGPVFMQGALPLVTLCAPCLLVLQCPCATVCHVHISSCSSCALGLM
jgi:hypothetical protein